MIKQIALIIQILFYLAAGFNHFRKPALYEGIMPPYLPWHSLLNTIAGAAEIILAAGLIFESTRLYAAYGIILMLLAFIPVHIYFIQMDSYIPGIMRFPKWVGWMRLLVIHPLLIAWAWWNRS